MATVGDDAGPYIERLDALAIDRRYVTHVAGSFTPRRSSPGSQRQPVDGVSSGRDGQSHLNACPLQTGSAWESLRRRARGMQQHAAQFAKHGIPFIFDLGQAMPLFSGEDLLWFIARATYVTLNDYEARVVVERTQLSLTELAQRVKALVVTRGAEGSTFTSAVPRFMCRSRQPAASSIRSAVAMPIGRLLYGISEGWTWRPRPPGGGDGRPEDRDERRPELRCRSPLDHRSIQEAYGYRPW